MIISNPMLTTVGIVMAAILLGIFWRLLPVDSGQEKLRRHLRFAVEVMASSGIYFGVMHNGKPVNIFLFAVFTLIYLVSIYLRARKLVSKVA